MIQVSVFTLSWDWIIAKEHVEKLHTDTSLIVQNSPFCKVLLCLQIYMRSVTYFWMFVEGLNILIPLCRGEDTKALALFHRMGCWIYHYPEIAWIVFFPNYSTVLCNFDFLILIMANIFLKNRTSTNRHRATFPQSLRSLICLIFLFGINFIVPWILHAVDSQKIIPYIFNRVVEGLQGVFVCIMWVFCSKEGQKIRTSSHRHLTQVIYPVSTAAPIVMDSSKVTEQLERVLELPETERLFRESKKLTTVDTCHSEIPSRETKYRKKRYLPVRQKDFQKK
uniref:Calcitonin receptor-like n=1 Tax=Crassostrea virginica TaxID=6565 RepID=A0A8B8C3R6_CRAVI|nr:calcitonin receptor-like [Crassostrea virginica]